MTGDLRYEKQMFKHQNHLRIWLEFVWFKMFCVLIKKKVQQIMFWYLWDGWFPDRWIIWWFCPPTFLFWFIDYIYLAIQNPFISTEIFIICWWFHMNIFNTRWRYRADLLLQEEQEGKRQIEHWIMQIVFSFTNGCNRVF